MRAKNFWGRSVETCKDAEEIVRQYEDDHYEITQDIEEHANSNGTTTSQAQNHENSAHATSQQHMNSNETTNENYTPLILYAAPPEAITVKHRVSDEDEIAKLNPILVVEYVNNSTDEVLLCKLSVVCDVYWAADLKVSTHYVTYSY